MSASADIFALQSKDAIEHWWQFAPFIERYCAETRTTTPEDLHREVEAKEKQLWGIRCGTWPVGIVLTQIYNTARGGVCRVSAAASSGHAPQDFQRLLNSIEYWARDLGCVAVEVEGRKGWKRVLNGYSDKAVLLEKAL